jgi:hypothetical protein
MPCIPIADSTFDICDFLQNIKPTFTLVLLQTIFIPVILIIVITLVNKDQEDIQWFIFNTSVLNLILGISWEILIFYPGNIPFNQTVYQIFKDLAQFSIFPLAFTRVLFLYLPQLYEKIFSKKRLFLFIIGYDAIMMVIFYMYFELGYLSVYVCLVVLLLIGTFTCSFLVLLKIRQMIKLVEHNTKLDILYDLRKAAIVCICQAGFYSIYMALVFYYRLYLLFMGDIDPDRNNGYHVALIITDGIRDPLYLIFVIADTVLPMVLLKSYKKKLSQVKMLFYLGKEKKKAENQPITKARIHGPKVNTLIP